MTVRFRADGTTGKVAIFTGDDLLPFNDPLGNMSRVKFHSSLAYPKIIHQRTVTLSLPQIGTYTSNYGGVYTHTSKQAHADYELFLHGRPGVPWVLASFDIGGQKVGATGSVPVQLEENRTGFKGVNARWFTVGADATKVYASQYCMVTYLNYSSGPPRSPYRFPAMSLPVTVWVTDKILA